MSSVSEKELEQLMSEFPDWKEQFPDIYKQVNPERYSKIKKNYGKGQGNKVIQKRKSAPHPKTDYQATYDRKKGRPRSTKRPPPSPRDLFPPPMTFDTNQRSDFIPKDLGVRAELVKHEENHERPDAPFDGTTYYGQEFGSFTLPEIVRAKPIPDNHKKSSAKFQKTTTSKEHYKTWVPQPSIAFGELPSFTGSLLYPDRNPLPDSTTQATFKGKQGIKPEMARMAEGNLKIEGETDFETTTSKTYKGYEGAEPARRVKQNQELSMKRGKFDHETQAMKDFPGFGGRMPRPPLPAEPAPATISLKFNNKTSFQTEQRGQFTGIDTSIHLVPKSCKKDADTYTKPEVSFETQTNQKLDYQPIDIKEAYVPPAHIPKSKQDKNLPKFNGSTMNDYFFKKWDVKPRVRYGDFHEGRPYIPPRDKFDTKSTTQDTFLVPQSSEVTASFKPEQKQMVGLGDHDFNTVYAMTFQEFSASKKMDKIQKQKILEALKKRKAEKERAQINSDLDNRYTVAAK